MTDTSTPTDHDPHADTSATTLRQQAALSYKAGDYEATLGILTRATAQHPEDPVFHYERGRTLAKLSKHPEALEALQCAAKLGGNLASVFHELGVTHRRLGQLEEARAALERALELKPGQAASRTELERVKLGIETLAARQQRTEAARAPSRSDRLPGRGVGDRLVAQGQLLEQRGMLAKALASFEAAVEASSASPESTLALATALRGVGRYLDAVTVLRKTSSPTIEVRLLEGRLCSALGDPHAAEAAFRAALDLESSPRARIVAATVLGRLLVGQERYTEALSVLAPIATVEQPSRDSVFQLARAHLGAGDLATAEAVLNGIIQQSDSDCEAWATLGKVLVAQGRQEAARAALENARSTARACLATPSTTETVRYAAARVLARAGCEAEAIAALEAQAWTSADPDPWLELARLHRASGALSKAQQALNAAAQRAPESAAVKEQQRILQGDLNVYVTGWLPQCSPTSRLNPEAPIERPLVVLEASLPQRQNGYAIRSHYVIDALKQQGFRVVAATRPGQGDAGRPSEWVDGIEYCRLPLAGDLNYNHHPLDEYLQIYADGLAQLARRVHPDLVHATSNFKNALAGIALSRLLQVPFVYELRGLWEDSQVSVGATELESDRYRYFRELEDYCLQEADAVVTISTGLRADLIARGVPEDAVFVVPNAVAPERFPVQPRNDEIARRYSLGAGMVFGYVGSLVAYEGLDLLIEAFTTVVKEEPAARLLIVGDGAERGRLQSRCAELGLDSYVRFVDPISHDQIPQLYAGIDAVVLPRYPSRVTELVTPLKPLEAMSAGRAVIVADLPAMREIVQNGLTGVTFSAGSVDALAEACLALARAPERARFLGAAAASWVRSERTWLKVGAEYAVAYAAARRRHADRQSTNAPRPHRVPRLQSGPTLVVGNAPTTTLRDEPLALRAAVEGGRHYRLRGRLETAPGQRERSALVSFDFGSSYPLDVKSTGLRFSKTVGLYEYLPTDRGDCEWSISLTVPAGAREVTFRIRTWHAEAPIALSRQLAWSPTAEKKADKKKKRAKPRLVPGGAEQLESAPPSPMMLEAGRAGWTEDIQRSPVVLAIMDEFTTGCFAPECHLIRPRPDNWRALVDQYRPDLIFVESAWKGNGGTWQYRIAEYSNCPGPELHELAHYAKNEGIPLVFWNKEDPVHYEKFLGAALVADVVLTTDANKVPSYLEAVGHERVSALPFAAQPALHRPQGLAGRRQRVCFAGSWYGGRHALRADAMRWLLTAAKPHGLDIYDRNYGSDLFAFPPELADCVVGSLSYAELCTEYGKYRVFLNVNSVQTSPTMFSRRVLELLACGTPVVSTYARGIAELLGNDAVWFVESEREADEAIRALMNDDDEWRRRSLEGIRRVFAGHTYRHRLASVFEAAGLSLPRPVEPRALITANIADAEDAAFLGTFRQNQSWRHFDIAVSCVGSWNHGDAPTKGLRIFPTVDELRKHTEHEARTGAYDLIGRVSSNARYGRHYLQDLVNASRYSPDAGAWALQQRPERFGPSTEYSQVGCLLSAATATSAGPPHAYIVDSDQFEAGTCA